VLVPAVANLSVFGRDRTGVVARFTNYLFDAGANIEAIEERVRRGQFQMLLQASFPDGFDEKRVRRRIADLGNEMAMEVRFRVHDPRAPRRTALFVTKETHCLDAVMEAVGSGRLPLDVRLVAGNRKDLAPLAKKHDLPFHHVPWTTPDRGEARALKLLDKEGIDLIVLARFMRILSPSFVWRFPNRIVNVHPSLLPSFPGASAYRQAWEHGVRVAGATAHFVTPDLDQGPILAQKAFQLRRDESLVSLKKRGQEAEAEVLVEALELCLKEDLDVHWGRVWYHDRAGEA
jgi:formyltetrahydrofolate deformylase